MREKFTEVVIVSVMKMKCAFQLGRPNNQIAPVSRSCLSYKEGRREKESERERGGGGGGREEEEEEGGRRRRRREGGKRNGGKEEVEEGMSEKWSVGRKNKLLYKTE